MTCNIKKGLSVLIGVALLVFLVGLGDEVYAKNGPRDSDKDGLTDQQERQLRTNPRDPDTDDDGLSDGLEVNDANTNPRDADSDDDGSDDGDEMVGDTDPNDMDSDDDGVDDSDDDDNDPIEGKKFESALVPASGFTLKEGEVEIEGESGNSVYVKVEMKIKDVRDAVGNLVTDTGCTLFIDAALDDGTPNPLILPFEMTDGEANVEGGFDLSGESLSIAVIILKRFDGTTFAMPGLNFSSDDDDDDDNDDDD